MIHETRIRRLNSISWNKKGHFVLYWMQQSQRAVCNHALEYAVQVANQHNVSLLVVFGPTPDYPEANRRHYAFMMEGLEDTERQLHHRGIPLNIDKG